MKIIAVVDKDTYIVSIDRNEIEKVFDKFYRRLDFDLKTGTDLNLAGGHDFRGDISQACDAMTAAMERFERARATLMAFSIMVSNLPKELQPETEGGNA